MADDDFHESDHAEVASRLEDAGLSFQDIADQEGVSVELVVRVSLGHDVSEPIREAIALELGADVDELWPSGYRSVA